MYGKSGNDPKVLYPLVNSPCVPSEHATVDREPPLLSYVLSYETVVAIVAEAKKKMEAIENFMIICGELSESEGCG